MRMTSESGWMRISNPPFTDSLQYSEENISDTQRKYTHVGFVLAATELLEIIKNGLRLFSIQEYARCNPMQVLFV